MGVTVKHRVTRAPSGHRAGAHHQRAKLSTEQVKEMRELREIKGLSYSQLARMFGCGISTARDIVNYYTRICG